MARKKNAAPPPEKTLLEKYAHAVESLEYYIEDMRRSLAREEADRAKFCEMLSNPERSMQNEMEWGDKLFATAAAIEVRAYVLRIYDKHKGEVSWKQIRDHVLERMILGEARSTSFSTGQSHNLAERHKLAAFASLHERELTVLAGMEAKVNSLAFLIQAEGIVVEPNHTLEALRVVERALLN